MMEQQKLLLTRLNPCITCLLCRGYLVDATTITECLHTFCKSCVVKHLQKSTKCPTCDLVIHQSHPLNYISHDRTMQDIVYKLVPNLQINESRRQIDFYKKQGLPLPSVLQDDGSAPTGQNNNNEPEAETDDGDNHRNDEQVNVCLECSAGAKLLKRKFIRCSSQATITHLKKYIAYKIYNDIERYKDFDILCNNELVGKDHTLKFITVTRWRAKNQPLSLQYRPKTAQ